MNYYFLHDKNKEVSQVKFDFKNFPYLYKPESKLHATNTIKFDDVGPKNIVYCIHECDLKFYNIDPIDDSIEFLGKENIVMAKYKKIKNFKWQLWKRISPK